MKANVYRKWDEEVSGYQYSFGVPEHCNAVESNIIEVPEIYYEGVGIDDDEEAVLWAYDGRAFKIFAEIKYPSDDKVCREIKLICCHTSADLSLAHFPIISEWIPVYY